MVWQRLRPGNSVRSCDSTALSTDALDVMRDSIHEWNMAARKILRYGNLYDFEELDEELLCTIELARHYLARRMDDSVQARHRREIAKSDAVIIDGLIQDSQSP